MRVVRLLSMLCGALALAACDGASPGDAGGDGGTGATTETTTSASSSTGVVSTDPQAPQLDTVAALHGALHVFWTNVTSDCEAIEIERKTEATPTFTLAFTVTGDVEDQSDDSATDYAMVYTYRLRCMKDGTYSPYSAEGSRKPKPAE